MTDPTPRPPAGTDPAPCPDCGGDLHVTVGEDSDGQWWDLDCAGPLDPKGCGWCAYEVEDLALFTLAGAPWTSALWAEVERLRAEAAELRLDLAAEQGRQEGAPSAGWEFTRLGTWHKAGPGFSLRVSGGWPGAAWSRFRDGVLVESDGAPNARAAMKAADEAEAQAAAKEPTP